MTWRRPPLWFAWALTVIVFAGTAAAVVIAIRSGDGSTAAEESAAREANREGQIVVARDQAPHAVALRRAASPERALERAIASDMRGRVRRHELDGPIKGSECTHSPGRRATRQALRCIVRAGDVAYPFLGVVDVRARRITWCKRDPPPTPALDIPVSRRCRG